MHEIDPAEKKESRLVINITITIVTVISSTDNKFSISYNKIY